MSNEDVDMVDETQSTKATDIAFNVAVAVPKSGFARGNDGGSVMI